MNSLKYLYGPVQSWRLGKSMGLDPLSLKNKVCNMDCVYCQLGPTLDFSPIRQTFISTTDILNEVWSLNPYERFDHFTISGRGEPTLAANLSEIITGIKKMRPEKIAVITNSSLLWRESVREDLMKADKVLAKLDACDQESFGFVDKPESGLSFSHVVEGLWKFRQMYKGFLSLDVMFVPSTIVLADRMASLTKALKPDAVHLNTPLRDCAADPVAPAQMLAIREAFAGQNVTTVYDEEQNISVWNDPAVVRRHGRPRQVKVVV